jgi:hypothetical protein
MERRSFFQAILGGTAAIFGSKLAMATTSAPMGLSLPKTIVTSYVSPETTEQINLLSTLLQTPLGRQQLALSLGPAIRRRRDYMSLVRKAFCVVDGDSVSSLNDFNLYAISPTVGGFRFRTEGAKGIKATLPTSQISSNVVFPFKHVENRRFDLVARAINLGRAEVVAAENSQMFTLMDAVVEEDIEFGCYFLTEARYELSRKGVAKANLIFANPFDATEILKIGHRVNYDPNCTRITLKTGLLGYVDGVGLYQSRSVPKGYMYVTGETDPTRVEDGLDDAVYAGYVADKAKLSVTSYDPSHGWSTIPSERHFGFILSEETGFAINPDAVQRVSMKEWKGTGWNV